ncbi:MAG: hypothetical protein J6Y25_04640 [Elusimicrobiaceae bacterium]|nr:hypothetical protein [Elusimicrobiaceae bacterium]
MTRTYTKDEIYATLESARHVAEGIIGVWRAAAGPESVRLAVQIQDAYENDIRRLLHGGPTLQDIVHSHIKPDHGMLAPCGQKPECRNVESCKNCSTYELFLEKIRTNFRD